MNPECIVIDGSSFLFRAFFATQRAGLTSRKGFPTGAVLSFSKMISNLLKKYPGVPEIMVFDAPHQRETCFRNKIYPEYKATRPPVPEDLSAQFPYVRDISAALGMLVLQEPGVEADDTIGTLAAMAGKEHVRIMICSGDKDLSQLVKNGIEIYDTMKETVLDREGVIEKFGVPPELIADYLAIAGDSSDNIPGMKGAGPKTAAAVLNAFGGIEKVAAAGAEETKALGFRGAGKFHESFIAQLETIRLSKVLSTIKTDVPLGFTLKSLTPGEPDWQKVFAIADELDLRDLRTEALGHLGESAAKPEAAPEPERVFERTVVRTADELASHLKALGNEGPFAIFPECSVSSPVESTLSAISISAGERTVLVRFSESAGSSDDLFSQQEGITKEEALSALRTLLEDPKAVKAGHDLKRLMNVLFHEGVRPEGFLLDTMLMDHVLNAAERGYSLRESAERHYAGDISFLPEEKSAGRKKAPEKTDDEKNELLMRSSELVLQLSEKLKSEIESAEWSRKTYYEVEQPLIAVLSLMERTGASVSVPALSEASKQFAEGMERLEKRAFEEAGTEFNIASPKQVGEIIYGKLGVEPSKKTGSGQNSTKEDILSDLAPAVPLAGTVLEWRGLAKLRGTYSDVLPGLIDHVTGRVHTNFNQTGTSTGRLSSSDPNLQNIPARTEEGRLIRKAFAAEEGWDIVSCDYSQIELRLMAELSGDEGLRKAFLSGADIHRHTAAEIFGKTMDEVTPDERRKAKAVNFGLMYGMGAFGLARRLRIDRKDAADYIALYFSRFPKVKTFISDLLETAHRTGYVETITGRHLFVPGIQGKGMALRAAERVATNAPLQGSAADLIKLAMVKVAKFIEDKPVRLSLQVHDELVMEVRHDAAEEVANGVADIMRNVMTLSIPLDVGIGIGPDWDSAH